MLNVPAAARKGHRPRRQDTPLTGIVIGALLSLVLWALALAIVVAVR